MDSPKPKSLNQSYKAKKDIVNLFGGLERIDGDEYNGDMKNAAYMEILPEADHQKFEGDANLDVDALTREVLEAQIEAYTRSNMSQKARGLNNVEKGGKNTKEGSACEGHPDGAGQQAQWQGQWWQGQWWPLPSEAPPPAAAPTL